MIDFEKRTLENGLKVILHKDTTTPMVAVNSLYDVGARDEDPNRTGFAHLFEHLMFGGSVNVPDFDKPLQFAGGNSNAFTSNDITNYYDSLPVVNLETALWLESDRLLSLAFTEKSLEVQRSVVIEEFKQRYLNQPYGDVWHIIRKAAYKKHPYQWPTIGKDISHIEEASMDDVKSFFYKHYGPKNLILTIAGNIDIDNTFELVQEWYNDIPSREEYVRNISQEHEKTNQDQIEHQGDVPSNALYIAFKMCDRLSDDYPVYDLLSDILAKGKSSRLYNKLVNELRLTSDAHAFISGSFDPGLFMIVTHLNDGVDFEQVEKVIWEELDQLKQSAIDEPELQKVINKYESAKLFGNTTVLNRAMALSYFELLGDADNVNHEIEKYRKVNSNNVQRCAGELFNSNRSTVLRYKKKS